jgi:hypothetical protein
MDHSGGNYYIKRIKQKKFEKYIQENSDGKNYIELMADGSFVLQFDQGISSGIYESEGDSILLIILEKGRMGAVIKAQPGKNHLKIDGFDENGTKLWKKR